jgi:hypothetical protein
LKNESSILYFPVTVSGFILVFTGFFPAARLLAFAADFVRVVFFVVTATLVVLGFFNGAAAEGFGGG